MGYDVSIKNLNKRFLNKSIVLNNQNVLLYILYALLLFSCLGNLVTVVQFN